MINFESDYLTKQLITYLGNKRKLLPFIDTGLQFVLEKLGKDKAILFDGFSGSGVVSRLLKNYATTLYVNDLENYTYTLNQCYLGNEPSFKYKKAIDDLNHRKLEPHEPGFIERNYAPKDDDNVQPKERVFYTKKNAQIIDHVRSMIMNDYEESYFPYLMSPLIVKASIHNNTSGVFKGFHKKNNIGHFGGAGENALVRIKGEIQLEYPVFLNNDCEVKCFKEDTNQLIKTMPEMDVAYYDPPYNQHPYGSNYFMLNIINNKEDNPSIQDDGVSGIATDWNRSGYNKWGVAAGMIEDLIANTPAKFILMSYNNEGIVPRDKMDDIFSKYGDVQIIEKDYNAYRGSRNLNERDIKVKELLWVLKKK